MTYHNNLNNILTNMHVQKLYEHDCFYPPRFTVLHSIHLEDHHNSHQPILFSKMNLKHWLQIRHLPYHYSQYQERDMLYMHYFMNQHRYLENFRLKRTFRSMKKFFLHTVCFLHFHMQYVSLLLFISQSLAKYQFRPILLRQFIP